MLSRGAEHYPTGKCERMFRSGHRNEPDCPELDALQALALHVEDAADPDVCSPVTKRALDSTERLAPQTKRHGWYK